MNVSSLCCALYSCAYLPTPSVTPGDGSLFAFGACRNPCHRYSQQLHLLKFQDREISYHLSALLLQHPKTRPQLKIASCSSGETVGAGVVLGLNGNLVPNWVTNYLRDGGEDAEADCSA
jgi:hypothetical protein